MGYPSRFDFRASRAFSLAEVLIVVMIIGLLVGISTSVYYAISTRDRLASVVEGFVEAERTAKANAERGNGDSSWGVRISSGSGVVFRGSSYASRISSDDRPFSISSAIVISGLTEIVFQKGTGIALSSGTTTFVNDGFSRSVYTNAKGMMNY